jgi:hypothetical protein
MKKLTEEQKQKNLELLKTYIQEGKGIIFYKILSARKMSKVVSYFVATEAGNIVCIDMLLASAAGYKLTKDQRGTLNKFGIGDDSIYLRSKLNQSIQVIELR